MPIDSGLAPTERALIGAARAEKEILSVGMEGVRDRIFRLWLERLAADDQIPAAVLEAIRTHHSAGSILDRDEIVRLATPDEPSS